MLSSPQIDGFINKLTLKSAITLDKYKGYSINKVDFS